MVCAAMSLLLMTTPRSPSTASDPPRGSGLAWGGPARRPVKDRLQRDGRGRSHQPPLIDDDFAIQRDRAAAQRQVEVAERMAARHFVGPCRVQEVAGEG